MTSTNNAHSDSLSPLAFARAYQVYRQQATAEPFDDTRILLAARFWSDHHTAFDNPPLATFWQEDLPPLIERLSSVDFNDLHPSELEEIADFLEEINRRGVLFTASGAEAHTPDLPQSLSHPVWSLAARKWFYLGDMARALTCLKNIHPESIPTIESQDLDDAIGPDVIERLAERVEDDNPPLSAWLKRFASDWRDTLDSGYPNRARCLLVEQNAHGVSPRGRMTDIEARVEPITDGDTDEIVIDHQVRRIDDPHIGSFATALAVLRSRATNSSRSNNHHKLSGRYTISRGRGQLVSGGSMGLAAFAVSYGAWRNRDLHRDRHIIGRSVALIGAIAPDGTVSKVSPDTLRQKIERVCHSPVTHVAIPEPNRADAETILADLHARYPNRRLHLLPITTITDLLDDRNIIRPERLCLGEFAVKQVGRWGKSWTVQVPILIALLYTFVCLVEPKAWVLFDGNPHYMHLTSSGFGLYNSDSVQVNEFFFPCKCDPANSQARVGNLDSDAQNEFAYLLASTEAPPCSLNATLFVYDDDGTLMFRESCIILHEYPDDSTDTQPYQPAGVSFLQVGDSALIQTTVSMSFHARSHLKFWTPSGKLVGWYINQGFVNADPTHSRFVTDHSVWLLAYNNRVYPSSTAAMELPLFGSQGVSPPMSSDDVNLDECTNGNELQYIIIPPTDLCLSQDRAYNGPGDIYPTAGGGFRFSVKEYDDPKVELWYFVDSTGHVYDVRVDDHFWPTRDALVEKGVLPQIKRVEFLDRQLASIKYWNSRDSHVSDGT